MRFEILNLGLPSWLNKIRLSESLKRFFWTFAPYD